ncbi:MAG: DNA polymerase III subunit delta [Planctomycetaceae bacterium]|nr:DNA polymerase III subunit delta [Planctomycetaceae bacterium]
MTKTGNTWHALEWPTDIAELPSTVVLFGKDNFLIEMSLRQTYSTLARGDRDAIPPQKLEGERLSWNDLDAELSTGSLFSQGFSQPVVVIDAETFISKHRPELESWVARPTSSNTLILVTDSWLATTKLYKLVQQHGVLISCDPPTTSAKSKSIDAKQIAKWIARWAKVHYRLEIPSEVGSLLWELSQDSFGMVDTSLAKLSLLFPPESTLTPSDIRTHVGGWKADTVWQAIDQALDGQAMKAIETLHPIFHAGEHPLSVMGQMSWTLRRYALAYDHYNQARLSRGGKADMKQSLLAAGFREWGSEVEKAAGRLKRLGRRRLDSLHRWLLEIDMALKFTHSDEALGRQLIERLLIQLSD